MERKSFVQRVSLGNSNQALIVSHITFDEDGFGTTTAQGLINIEPGKNGLEMLRKAAQSKWNLSGTPNRQSNFMPNVEKGEKLSDAVLATAKATANSISVEIPLEDEVGADVLQSAAEATA